MNEALNFGLLDDGKGGDHWIGASCGAGMCQPTFASLVITKMMAAIKIMTNATICIAKAAQ